MRPINPFEAFENIALERRVNLHGFMVVKSGTVMFEKYYHPFNEFRLHRMFSIANSLTSLAVGKMIDDGLIRLDDKICDYFPKYVDNNTHPWIKEVTIREMLSMSTCHSQTTYKLSNKDWVRTFFKTKPDHRPGTVFCYDASAAHVLGALVEKLTKQDILEYLRADVLKEIGFSEEAYMMKDPSGISMGESGLMCTLRDITKLGILLINEGQYNGKQLISAEYIQEATKKQVQTDPCGSLDEGNGYGFMFWRARKEGYCMYGRGGQICIIIPEYELVFSCIADTQNINAGLQALYDSFYETIYEWAAVKKWEPQIIEKFPYVFGTVRGKEESLYHMKLQDKFAVFEDNPMGVKKALFDFLNKKIFLYFENSKRMIPYEFNGWADFVFPNTKEKAVASGAWVSRNQFLLKIELCDEDLSPLTMEFGFRPDGAVTLRMKGTSEPSIVRDYAGFAGGKVEK